MMNEHCQQEKILKKIQKYCSVCARAQEINNNLNDNKKKEIKEMNHMFLM